jgi:hypothetical protein
MYNVIRICKSMSSRNFVTPEFRAFVTKAGVKADPNIARMGALPAEAIPHHIM